MSAREGEGALVGESAAMVQLLALLERVAASEIDVLVRGESGTGKEVVARELVRRSARAARPFVVVDCGALSPSLVESELFGHVRYAFTGAERDRQGAFEAANGGTLLLDEVGELPLDLQPKLLRALEAREVRRVGETHARRIDVRMVAATHRDLEALVASGRFREDLYYRLAKVTLDVPPLRARRGDIDRLVRRLVGSEDLVERLFPPPVLAAMAAHPWPGNVRELRNYVERSLVLEQAPPLSSRPPGDPAGDAEGAVRLPVDRDVPFRVAKERAVEAFERAYLAPLLESCGGNVSKAARVARMDRMYLHQLAEKHGFRSPRSEREDG